MVSYNKVTFIEQAINSILNQTYQNFELLILDAESTDGTLDILKLYEDTPKVKIIIEKDQGMYHARNKGILMATGDIIGFLNTDDFYAENALEVINKGFITSPYVDIVYGSMNIIDKNGNIVKEFPKLYVKEEKDRIINDLNLPDQATFIKRDQVAVTGLYDLHYKITADWDFWQRCIIIGLNLKMIPFIVASFRHYEDSLTFSDKYAKLRFTEKIRYYRKYNDCTFSKVIFSQYLNYYLKRPIKSLLGINRVR
jgi:glycosyltransferase involved in cell wall biosynthesis